MLNSIINFGSTLYLSTLHSAENGGIQQSSPPAQEGNDAVQELARSRLGAPKAAESRLSTSFIGICSAPLSLLSSSLFREKVAGKPFNIEDEMADFQELEPEVTAENLLELLNSVQRNNNYIRLENCLSFWSLHNDEPLYLNLMRANLEPGSDSEKLFSLLAQTKNLAISLLPLLSPNKEAGFRVEICTDSPGSAVWKTIEGLSTFIPILNLKFACSPSQDRLLNFLILNPSLISLEISDANIHLQNLPLTEVQQQDLVAALTPKRIAHLKKKYPAHVKPNGEMRKDSHLTAAVLFSGAFPQEKFQVGEDIKEMVKLMPESMDHHKELVDEHGSWEKGDCSPLGTACLTHGVPVEIIKILVDEGAVHSEVKRNGKTTSLVEAVGNELDKWQKFKIGNPSSIKFAEQVVKRCEEIENILKLSVKSAKNV